MNSFDEFRSIIDDAEDLLRGGVRRPYAQRVKGVSVSEAPSSAQAASGESGADGESVAPVRAGNSPAATLSADERKAALSRIEEEVRNCTRCALHQGRTYGVPGMGVLDPLVMVIGEGPGRQEDRQGIPFVGPAGQYLDRWLASIGLSRRTNTFIGNIVKCRPPGNRDPLPEESAACLPYIERQIDLVRPKIILTVGRISTRILTGTAAGITTIHGKMFQYHGLPLIPTFHPSGVLRNQNWRRPVWEDLKILRTWLMEHTDHDGEALAGEVE